MPAAHKRKLIEANLGESLEVFLSKRIAAGQDVRSIARELDLDPGTIRYYVRKHKIPRPQAQTRESVSLHARDTKPLRLLLKGEHVDVCCCPLCESDCREKLTIHRERRCVLSCLSFTRKTTENA